MIYSEHLDKADESYVIRCDDNGHVIHVYEKDGEAIVFPSLSYFIRYLYCGETDIERFYVTENQMDTLYKTDVYSYYDLKDMANKFESCNE